MAGEHQAMFDEILQRTPGLLAIVLADRDGVVLEQAKSSALPESVLTSAFLGTMAIASEQAGKLGLQRNRSIVASYSNMQVVHFNMLPVIVTLFAASDANTAVILDLEAELQPAVDALMPLVASVQNI